MMLPFLLLGLAPLAAAVFQDEVGDIDFHYSLLGLPQPETSFFHKPRSDDKASLLYTLSDLGVLGAVNPSTGDLVWRHQIEADGTGYLRAPFGENWLAAARGNKVQAWNALSGRNIWQVEFQGTVKDLEILELSETSRKDVLALFDEDGITVLRRLHGGLGTVVWEFRENSKDTPLQISNNIANIYVISLHGTPASYNLKVISINTATGSRVDHWTVGTQGDIHAAKDVKFVGANSAAPIVAWATRPSKLSVNVIGTKTKQEFNLHTDAESIQVHAPHLAQSQPHFLVHVQTKADAQGEKSNKGLVFHTDLKTGQINLAYELPSFLGDGAFATSSDGANVYFTQASADESLVVSSDSHAILARWPVKNTSPVQAVSEVIKKPNGEIAMRSAVVTRSDDWTLMRNGERDWTRHEGLSGAVAAVWVEKGEGEDLAKVLAEEAHTNPISAYVHRVKRHLRDLERLPAYLASIPKHLVGNMAGADEGVDTFGFHRIVVVVTRRGRFYGLDSASGKILWTKKWFSSFDSRGILADGDTVTAYGAGGEHAVFNASTGEARSVSIGPSVFGTAVVETDTGKVLLPQPGPPTEDLMVIREGETIKAVRRGQDVWQLRLLPGQKIVDIATPSPNPIASIGRVLGDRRVMYKYLNANSIVLAISKATELTIQLVDSVSGQVLTSQVYSGVDSSVSCTAAENWYACSFFGDRPDGAKGYQLVVSDLYESPEPNNRGPLGDAANFSSLNPIDNPTGVALPWVVSQAYILSQPLTRLSVTQTRQGITTRLLVGYLPDAHGIVGLSRHVIDPRRPVGRDPSATEMEAEGLMRYHPALEIAPQTMLSHERDLLGIAGIEATATLVESTSMLVAYGVDVYVVRVAPSGVFDILGKSFGKATLVATVMALLGGVMFLTPMVHFSPVAFIDHKADNLQVRRKQINMQWGAFL
ncbi:DUF1620-domain-containing protein [Drechmeria coniospora]|uniref:ER membrane protein complex subunit 1 n=1 Tax=Drechmeria coniospora TaxID=98403 RepID=A0A151GLY1_DRECN|nr:DUF1620-domain-containing protein [Drechmeria coniospora]KYK58113.1 DUF1620-domain-containing protein [Drechmeria coniospora]